MTSFKKEFAQSSSSLETKEQEADFVWLAFDDDILISLATRTFYANVFASFTREVETHRMKRIENDLFAYERDVLPSLLDFYFYFGVRTKKFYQILQAEALNMSCEGAFNHKQRS